MADDSSRPALHAYVSDDAHDKWHGFAAEQGVSVSAILEALAPQLRVEDGDDRSVASGIDDVVKEARKIDAVRRRRRRD